MKLKLDKKLTQLLLVGGLGVGIYLAWDRNLFGLRDVFQDIFENIGVQTDDFISPQSPPAPTNAIPALDEFSYYPIGQAGSWPQTTHDRRYPFTYPYPPTGYQRTAAPQTLPAAHYQLAGTPNIRQIPGTTTIMAPPPAQMANPSLWFDKGGIVNPRSVINPGMIDYGPYRFDAPIFSSQRYPIIGTNIDYPFLLASTCPQGQYMGPDGRCWFRNNPYPSTIV